MEEEEDASPEVQVCKTQKKREARSRTSRKSSNKTSEGLAGRSISRCTRSQAAPEWTTEETMILVNQIAGQDDILLKALPSNQRWKIIAESCIEMNVNRSSNQCKRHWDSLLSEYNKIQLWEKSRPTSKYGSYWSLKSNKKKKFQLPPSFDEEVFGAIEGVIDVREALSDSEEVAELSDDKMALSDSEEVVELSDDDKMALSDSEEVVELNDDKMADEDDSDVSDDDDDDDSDDDDDDSDDTEEEMVESESIDSQYGVACARAGKGQAKEIVGMLEAEMADTDSDTDLEEKETKTTKVPSKGQEMANKLRENANKIHAILRGELPDNVNKSQNQIAMTKANAGETELIRRQADELIKNFEVLVSNLDQFIQLVNEGSCEGINLMNSKGS